MLKPDDATLIADGSDVTRVVLRVTDEFGDLRRYTTAAIPLTLEGPAEMIGDNPLILMAGCGAIWIRAKEQPGRVRLIAVHPVLGAREIELRIAPTDDERV